MHYTDVRGKKRKMTPAQIAIVSWLSVDRKRRIIATKRPEGSSNGDVKPLTSPWKTVPATAPSPAFTHIDAIGSLLRVGVLVIDKSKPRYKLEPRQVVVKLA